MNLYFNEISDRVRILTYYLNLVVFCMIKSRVSREKFGTFAAYLHLRQAVPGFVYMSNSPSLNFLRLRNLPFGMCKSCIKGIF